MDIQQGASKLFAMTNYVQTVEPTMVADFKTEAPACVVDAIYKTVFNTTGILPPQFFEVSVRSASNSLEQLLYTYLLKGFMYRNAMIRVDLKASLALPSAPENFLNGGLATAESLQQSAEDGSIATGRQLRDVTGTVLNWHNEQGVKSTPVQAYIQQMEADNAHLRQQNAELGRLLQRQHHHQNALLSEINELGPGTPLLTEDVGEDVHMAFRLFVERQLGPDHQDVNPLPEVSGQELAVLLFYTMAVGYNLCSMHISHGIASSLDVADYSDDDDY